MYKQCMKDLLGFFQDTFWDFKCKELFIKTTIVNKVVKKIQKRSRQKFQTKFAKVEVLINYWEKLLYDFMIGATINRDEKMKEMVK